MYVVNRFALKRWGVKVEHIKYGYCRFTSKWVKRDDMLGINIKVFDLENNESRISIRLSPEGHERFTKVLRLLKWDNILLTGKDLKEMGLL